MVDAVAVPLRVLVCNDDGPPGTKSDYILPMVRALEKRGWDTSVCIPAGHKSWTGKAMDPWAKVTVRKEAYSNGHPWWVCESGTPAAAANIGIHHMSGPFDLLISGPNFGRNSGACFVTSSGTVAAAMEGALSGLRAIALSFDTKMMEAEGKAADENLVKEGCELSLDLIWHLYRHWPKGVDLFNINVPLAEGRNAPIVQTCVERSVRYNSLYRPTQEDGVENSQSTVYEFACANVSRQAGVSSSVLSDADALNSGRVSVTPMLASLSVLEMRLDALEHISFINDSLIASEESMQFEKQKIG